MTSNPLKNEIHPMAEVIKKSLERSQMLIDLFSKDFEGVEWYQQPGGIPNPPLWTLAHIAYTRGIFLEMTTGKKNYPENWTELFRLGCPPCADPKELPAAEDCRHYLKKTMTELNTYLDNTTSEDLQSPPLLPSNYFKSKLEILVHLPLHEAHHTGTLSMARRLLGKKKII